VPQRRRVGRRRNSARRRCTSLDDILRRGWASDHEHERRRLRCGALRRPGSSICRQRILSVERCLLGGQRDACVARCGMCRRSLDQRFGCWCGEQPRASDSDVHRQSRGCGLGWVSGIPISERQRDRVHRQRQRILMTSADTPLPPRSNQRRAAGENGDTMLMTVVLLTFLMVGAWALISGSQQWGARRDAQAVASAAARAGAQVSNAEVRGGFSIDPGLASERANRVLSASGYSGSVSVNGAVVTVQATGSVGYAFPAPGFPSTLTASASSTAARGVQGDEGG
jgi:Flp pilus assembly protein TadG